MEQRLQGPEDPDTEPDLIALLLGPPYVDDLEIPTGEIDSSRQVDLSD